jgi:hypothetical protein
MISHTKPITSATTPNVSPGGEKLNVTRCLPRSAATP